MSPDQFWEIIAESRGGSMKQREAKLVSALTQLPEKEILAFHRFWIERGIELYTWPLRGTGFLAMGRCSGDSFTDWRDWIIACGKDAFVTARDCPDDLVALIDSEPEAGCEGFGYVALTALRTAYPKWKDTYPDCDDLRYPSEPVGQKWASEDDLRLSHPKTYKRFIEEATEQEKQWRDPQWVAGTFGVQLGEPQTFVPVIEHLDIDGTRATRMQLAPTKPKKPWWRFW